MIESELQIVISESCKVVYRDVLLNCVDQIIDIGVVEPFFCCLNYTIIPNLSSPLVLVTKLHVKIDKLANIRLNSHGEGLVF